VTDFGRSRLRLFSFTIMHFVPVFVLRLPIYHASTQFVLVPLLVPHPTLTCRGPSRPHQVIACPHRSARPQPHNFFFCDILLDMGRRSQYGIQSSILHVIDEEDMMVSPGIVEAHSNLGVYSVPAFEWCVLFIGWLVSVRRRRELLQGAHSTVVS
jgi:hypothetical protein